MNDNPANPNFGEPQASATTPFMDSQAPFLLPGFTPEMMASLMSSAAARPPGLPINPSPGLLGTAAVPPPPIGRLDPTQLATAAALFASMSRGGSPVPGAIGGMPSPFSHFADIHSPPPVALTPFATNNPAFAAAQLAAAMGITATHPMLNFATSASAGLPMAGLSLSATGAVQSSPGGVDVGSPATAPVAGDADGQPEWKEYKTDEGRVFWHNSKTGKSSWEKPEELKTVAEKILETNTAWREYASPTEETPPAGGDADDTNRSYWHNLETKVSAWEVPHEIIEVRKHLANPVPVNWDEEPKATKQDIQKLLKKFLEWKGIGYRAKWDEAIKIISQDTEWHRFATLTTGEKKQAFNEHIASAQKQKRERDRVKKAQARKQLDDFLKSWENGTLPDAPPLTLGIDFETDFVPRANQEAWFLVLDPADVLETLEEFLTSIESDLTRRTAYPSIADKVLSAIEECHLPIDAPFADVRTAVVAMDASLEVVHPIEIFTVWEHFVSDLTHEMKGRIKRIIPRAERKRREAFKQLLQRAEAYGTLNAKTEWVEFLHSVAPPLPAGESDPQLSSSRVVCEATAHLQECVQSGNKENVIESSNGQIPTDLENDDEVKVRLGGETKSTRPEMGSDVMQDAPIATPEALGDGRGQNVARSARPKKRRFAETAEESKIDLAEPEGGEVAEVKESFGIDEDEPAEAIELAKTEREDVNAFVDELKQVLKIPRDPHKVLVCELPEFLCLYFQGGSTARELFEIHVCGLWSKYEQLRDKLRSRIIETSKLGQLLKGTTSIKGSRTGDADEEGTGQSGDTISIEQFVELVEDESSSGVGIEYLKSIQIVPSPSGSLAGRGTPGMSQMTDGNVGMTAVVPVTWDELKHQASIMTCLIMSLARRAKDTHAKRVAASSSSCKETTTLTIDEGERQHSSSMNEAKNRKGGRSVTSAFPEVVARRRNVLDIIPTEEVTQNKESTSSGGGLQLIGQPTVEEGEVDSDGTPPPMKVVPNDADD